MPPKKKLSNEEASIKAIDYINSNNRPFGAQNIVDGLQGAISVPQMKKVLAELLEQEHITAQTYGKSLIYIPIQNPEDAPSQEELNDLDIQIKETRRSIVEQNETISHHQSQIKVLEAEPPDSDLPDLIEKLKTETKRLEAKLHSIVNEGNVVDESVRQKAIERYRFSLKQWQKRRLLCMDVVNTLADGMGAKPKEVAESISLETDSDVDIVPPKKRKRYD
ncbi:hypothetical protein GEMRC1_010486 [Eukaryota sp. GEM-RC1]